MAQAPPQLVGTEDGDDAEALAKLFARIDANADETIDWDEFSTYMLLESAVRVEVDLGAGAGAGMGGCAGKNVEGT
eukprot:365129-Chlamydomonas_euryale.AAC.19